MSGFILYIRYIKSARVTTVECRKKVLKNNLTIIYLYNFCYFNLYSDFGPKLCFILLLDQDYAFSAFEFSKVKHIWDHLITTIIPNRRPGVYICILLFLLYGRLNDAQCNKALLLFLIPL